ncbi:MAG: hypothetical protein ISS78_10845 [Phycisphaerae bacterium]|nr:hypothetical protein [Phycisphaerae bacterium]
MICGLLGIGLAGIAMANGALEGGSPAIMVSPSTIVLAKVDTISVHTNIPASVVVDGSLTLAVNNGIAYDVDRWGVDRLGHITFKFPVDALKLVPGEATLTLSGVLEDGPFSASDIVTVK